MLGVALRSSRTSLILPVSSALSEKIRHTSPPVTAGWSLPKRADSASTAWFGVAAPGGGATTGGTAATAGGAVKGGGKFGTDAGPEDGARFIAGPAGASGTDAGGTGGGRSPKNCAETGAVSTSPINKAKAGAIRQCPFHPRLPCLPQFMWMLFTENAANSSLDWPYR